MKSRLRLLIIAVLCLIAAPACAEELNGSLFKKEAPVEITADYLTYDKAADTYMAEGSVVIEQQGVTLRTDRAILDMKAGVATATGSVDAVDEGGNTLRGSSLQMDLKEKTAVVANARLYYREQNLHIAADVIRKTGPETYEGEKVSYTACECEEGEAPAWSFTASRAKITIGDFLTGRHAFFRIKGVPVLYSPFVSLPVKRERQSGFLQPKTGYSRLRGFVLDNSYFWAISRNTDATFYLDIETTRGIGKAAEYRYIRTKSSSGEVYFHSFKERDIERVREFRRGGNLSRPRSATGDRWRFKFLHTELLPGNVNIKANLDFVSDDEYFLDFGKTSQEKSRESIESNISITKSWSVYNLVTQFRLFNNLLSQDETNTIQRLPEITLTGADKRIDRTPFYFSLESSAVNFARHIGPKGQRVDLRPRLSLPLNPGGWFDFTASLTPRATFYLVDEDPNGRFFDRYLYEAKADLTTTFVRIYSVDQGSLKALRHTIRPRFTYTYIPEAVQSDLPQFDAVDNVLPASSITYALNSTITGKLMNDGVKSYFDYLYLDLSQSYDFREATRKLTSPADERRPFSNVNGELRVNPTNRVAFTTKGSYNVYERHFANYDAALALSDQRGDSASFSYRYASGINYLETNLRIKAAPPVDLTYRQRYSFLEYKALETTYGIEYRHQCYEAALTFTDRLEERVIYLTFSLSGIGRVAGFAGRLEPSR